MKSRYSKQARTKAQRQAWWDSLTFGQRQDYIAQQQEKKAEKRKPGAYKPLVCSVAPENKLEWLDKIAQKNPWLKKTA